MIAKLTPGDRYKTNHYGEIEIVNYTTCFDVDVMFVSTGHVTKTTAGQVRRGQVRDVTAPSVCGVGFNGFGSFSKTTHRKIYTTWTSMMHRCYDANFHKNNKTYKDCTVCPEWHNFQTFAEWMSSQEYEGKQLDKDIKIKGNKVYSPDTCMFVTHGDNARNSSVKTYSFLSPSGRLETITNLTEFCRCNSLDPSHMVKVHKGNIKSHKGWSRNEH